MKNQSTEIKVLNDNQVEKILSFWESSNQEDVMCNMFFGICAATADGHGILTPQEYDDMFRLKYKYGMKILRRIAKMKRVNNG